MKRGALAAMVLSLWLGSGIAAEAANGRVSQRAARSYNDAEKSVAQGNFAEALAILEATIEREPGSGVARSGMISAPYYPYYLMGVTLMEQGRYGEAVEAFRREVDQGAVQDDADVWDDLQQRLGRAERTDIEPPVIVDVDSEVLSTEFVDDGREIAEVRFRGTVIDGGGIASLTMDGQAVRFRETEDGFAFEQTLALDTAFPTVELAARDTAGNLESRVVRYDLPPLDLGGAAEAIHAVLVGVDRYDPSMRDAEGRCAVSAGRCDDPEQFACYSLPDLGAAAADARRFHDLLLRRGVPEENLHLLVSDDLRQDATRANVMAALDEVQRRLGDKVIFYFSGHGVNSRRQKNLMLLSDTQPWECGDVPRDRNTALEASSLGIDEVEQALMQAPFKERYVILDACRTPRLASTRAAGAAVAEIASGPGFSTPSTRGLADVRARGARTDSLSGTPPVVYYATREKNVSVEWTQKRSGYFTWYLLQGLRRDLPLDALGEFVQRRVREETRRNHCSDDDAECPYEQSPYLDLPKGLYEDYDRQQSTFILAAEPASDPSDAVMSRGAPAPPSTRRVVVVPDEDRHYFERKKKVAVVVGVGGYGKFSQLSPLSYTVPDADAVSAALEAQGFDVITMRDSDATRESVPDTLRSAAELLDEEGSTFLFFFSGHGFAEGGENYLATIDTQLKKVAKTGLPLDEVLEIMKSSRARRRVAFVDACRNAVLPGAKGAARSFADLERAEGTRVLFSTRQGSFSFEDPDLGHGLFSHFLVEGLNGAAAGNDGLVTFRDLADYVEDEVATYALKRGWEQTPFDAGEASGTFLLGRAGVAPPSSTAMERPEENMRPVAAGSFEIGAADFDLDERPVHEVEISEGFRIDRAEVTVAEFVAFLNDGNVDDRQRRRWVAIEGETPGGDIVEPGIARSPEGYRALRPDHPVTHVSWEGAAAYCTARGAELPTEAQWEYAARGNGWDGAADPGGANLADRSLSDRVLDSFASHDDGFVGTSPVCTFASSRDRLGLCDMAGNVAEWVQDTYDPNAYTSSLRRDPMDAGPGNERVARGSSWYDGPGAARVSRRQPVDAEAKLATVGFRCSRPDGG